MQWKNFWLWLLSFVKLGTAPKQTAGAGCGVVVPAAQTGPPIETVASSLAAAASPQAEQADALALLPSPEPRTKRKYDSHYIHLRRDLADMAVYVLERFEHLNARKAHYPEEDMRVLQELWGCDFLLLHREMGERMKGGDKWSAIENKGNEAELVNVVWPIDYAVANPLENDNDEMRGIQLWRIYTVQPKDVRGQLSRVVPTMVRYLIGNFLDDGHWAVGAGYAGLVNGKWRILSDIEMTINARHNRNDWIGSIMASAFTARYEWHVAFGTVPNGPRLLFPTNPESCLHLFNNRDRVPGKARREMLKHWVEEHWRDNETNDLAFVCNHLRGNTVFNWSGMFCELFVSQYDLEMNEYFKLQAKEWRAQRKHNKMRVHLAKKGKKDDTVRPN